MLVKDIKPIGKVGRNLLKDKNADDKIELIIEEPLRKACKTCKDKNIETVMSSANRKNILKENETRINKKEVQKMAETKLLQSFSIAGKGYVWLMINYNTLSDENRQILFNLEKEIGEDAIWFAKSSYNEFKNSIRRFFRLKPSVETFNDKYADEFKEKQVLLMYNNKYPRRSVFLRMPVDQNTTQKDVEDYYDAVLNKLKKQ